MFARKVLPESVVHTLRGGKVEEPKSTILLDRVEPLLPGGVVTDRHELGEVGVRVFRGQAAVDALSFTRAEREQTLRPRPSRPVAHTTFAQPRRRTVTRSGAPGSAAGVDVGLGASRVVRNCGQVIGVR